MQFCGVEELLQAKTGNKHLMGLMTAQSDCDAITEINCHHCKQKLRPASNIVLDGHYSCEHCRQEILFKPVKSCKQLVFYRFVNHGKIDPENLALIAVRCASCGAPMQVDAHKPNYPCTFCSVQNILPPALRQKRVLDDIFSVYRKRFFHSPS